MISSHSKRLVIFEGPDGVGKTTAAKSLAQSLGARYVHFPALKQVDAGLGRMYVEAMLPALLGYQHIVFDRSWLSEIPYGTVFRDGKDRLGLASVRMLERLAMRCATQVVWCRAPREEMEKAFTSRPEMLKDVEQLHAVSELYRNLTTALPSSTFDWTADGDIINHIAQRTSTESHLLSLASAGSWHAPMTLVGEAFAERKDQDPLYQWPFASFSGEGCSRWWTTELDRVGLKESSLLWVNADQDLTILRYRAGIKALGAKASEALARLGIEHREYPHPQAWKRFHYGISHPLLKEDHERTMASDNP